MKTPDPLFHNTIKPISGFSICAMTALTDLSLLLAGAALGAMSYIAYDHRRMQTAMCLLLIAGLLNLGGLHEVIGL